MTDVVTYQPAGLPDLDYHGKAMRWPPTRVRLVSGGTPLPEDEPADYYTPGEIRNWLIEGYVAIVECCPGDGTRYTLILSPRSYSGYALTTTGHMLSEPVMGSWEEPVPDISAGLEWTRIFMAWWLAGMHYR